MRPKRRRVLYAAVVTALAALGLGVAALMRAVSERATAAVAAGEATFDPAPPLSPAQLSQLLTDDDYLIRFMQKHGPEAAGLGVAEAAASAGEDCHHRAHQLGRLAYALFGPRAFALASHTCQAGAMHGATEEFLRERGMGTLGSDVDALCQEAHNQFFRHQCLHGVGHGLLAWVEYELPEALDLCDGLLVAEDRDSCFSGVFMENIDGTLAGAMGHQNHYLRNDDPHFPCNAVADRFVPSCYFLQTSHMYVVFDGDFGAIAAECAKVPDSAKRLCFRSMGRDVGNHLRGQPQKAIDACGLVATLSHRLDCLEEAVQDRFWEVSGAEEVLEFCRLLEGADENERCYWKIAWRASQLFESEAGYREFCSRFEEDYRWLCDLVLEQQQRTDWMQ